MRFRQTFALITLVATLQADTISFGQLNGSKSGFYKMFSYLNYFRKPSPQTSQKSTTYQNAASKLKQTIKKMNANPPYNRLNQDNKKQEYIDALLNKEPKKRLDTLLDEVWKIIYANNLKIIDQLDNISKKKIANIEKFATQEKHTQFFCAETTQQFIYSYGNIKKKVLADFHHQKNQINRINSSFLEKFSEQGGALYKIADQLDEQLKKQTLSESNIVSTLFAGEQLVSYIEAIDKILQGNSNVNDTTKNNVSNFLYNIFYTIATSQNIAQAKTYNDYYLLIIKAGLYEYLFTISAICTNLFNAKKLDTTNLKKAFENKQKLIQTYLNGYRLLNKNFDHVRAKKFFDTIFTKINNKAFRLSLHIVKKTKIALDTFFKEKINSLKTQLLELLKKLKEQRLALSIDSKKFFTDQEYLSYQFINDYLTQLDNYQQTADLYISLMQTEQNQSALLQEIKLLVQSLLDQQEKIPTNNQTTQAIYNYLVTRSIAQYTSATMRTIIRLYGYYGNTNNEQLKTIQDYVSKLESYAKARTLDSNK